MADAAAPLLRPEDLARHTLLHLDYHGASHTWFDWGTWLTALGIEDLKPAGSLRFSRYDQMIQAAMDGQGVALGVSPLINEAIRSGTLVAPFDRQVDGPHGYYLIRSTAAAAKPQVAAFVAGCTRRPPTTWSPSPSPSSPSCRARWCERRARPLANQRRDGHRSAPTETWPSG